MGRFNKKIKEELESLEKKVVFERWFIIFGIYVN